MSEENRKEPQGQETQKQETSLSKADLRQVSGGILIDGQTTTKEHEK